MALPKTTTDRILADADKFAFVVPYDGSNKFYNDDLLKGYIAGATAENVRAQKLVEALEALVSILPTGDTLNYYFAKTEVINARKELQQWNGTGKEVEG